MRLSILNRALSGDVNIKTETCRLSNYILLENHMKMLMITSPLLLEKKYKIIFIFQMSESLFFQFQSIDEFVFNRKHDMLQVTCVTCCLKRPITS